MMAGEFTGVEKMQRSIKMNMPWFILYFVSFVGLLLFIYFLGEKDENGNSVILNKKGIISVAVALSIAFGFILLILFLGYGLVQIPIAAWKNSELQESLNRELFEVATVE